MTNITVDIVAQYIEEIKDKIDPRKFTEAVRDIAEVYDFTAKEYVRLQKLLGLL